MLDIYNYIVKTFLTEQVDVVILDGDWESGQYSILNPVKSAKATLSKRKKV